MSGEECFCYAFVIAFGFFEYGELVGINGLVLVDAGLDVTTSEVATIGSRKSSGAQSSDGCALPKAVVNVGRFEGRLFRAGIFKRLSDGTFPGGFGNVVIGAKSGNGEE